MTRSCCIIIFLSIGLVASKLTKNVKKEVRSFPDYFLFGSGTSAYQVEGAWDKDGKSDNIWDGTSHSEPCVVIECHSGDVADDSYHHVERDVEMVRELGLDYYRFSLSWTRILPTSFPDTINQPGVQYYNKLINELLRYNIQPMVTIYHWDLPQTLQDLGGWANPYIVDWFGDFARVCFEQFGDRVKNWITINEPTQVCGYGSAAMAILFSNTGVANYICSKNLLLAHAKAYHIYDKEFRSKQGGIIAMTFRLTWYEPLNGSAKAMAAAEIAREFLWGIYINPIFSKSGDFPALVKKRVAVKSAEQGFPKSRLPEFTLEEVQYIKGTSDYFGLNHYTTVMVRKRETSNSNDISVPSLTDDLDVDLLSNPDWKPSALHWLKVVPWGMYKLLTFITEKYYNPPIFIIENGFPTIGGLEDDDRISYYYQYLGAVLDAIENGSDVRAFTTWSLMDNFEWMEGYTQRFGLYEVDYSDPARKRTPRKSAFAYKQIVRSRQLDTLYQLPHHRNMIIDPGH